MDNKVEDKSNPKPEDVNPKKEYDLTVRAVKNLLPIIPLARPIDPRLPEIPGVVTMIMKVKSGKCLDGNCKVELKNDIFKKLKEVKEGDYVLVDTGRWSKTLKRLSDGVELRDIEYDGVLAVANKDNMPSELQQLLLKNG